MKRGRAASQLGGVWCGVPCFSEEGAGRGCPLKMVVPTGQSRNVPEAVWRQLARVLSLGHWGLDSAWAAAKRSLSLCYSSFQFLILVFGKLSLFSLETWRSLTAGGTASPALCAVRVRALPASAFLLPPVRSSSERCFQALPWRCRPWRRPQSWPGFCQCPVHDSVVCMYQILRL